MQKGAYEIAKAGGRNQGVIQRFGAEREAVIRKAIRSLEKRIAEHEDKIANPWAYIDSNTPKFHADDLVSRYWPREITNFRQQIDVLNGILMERGYEPAS